MFSFAARNRAATSSSICEAANFWPQVEDQGSADQTEAEARRDERNQHSGREDQPGIEASASTAARMLLFERLSK